LDAFGVVNQKTDTYSAYSAKIQPFLQGGKHLFTNEREYLGDVMYLSN